MATKVDVVMKAFRDDGFRDVLFSNPDKALRGYDLSREDERAVRQLDRRNFDTAANRMERDLYDRLRRGDIENPSVSENASIWDTVDP